MTSVTNCLDLRGLEPPEPMRRALEAVEALAAGDAIQIVTDREPMLLQRELERRGHSYVTGGAGQAITTTIRRSAVPTP